jgi:hypothetical protein
MHEIISRLTSAESEQNIPISAESEEHMLQ